MVFRYAQNSGRKSLCPMVKDWTVGAADLVLLGLCVLLCGFPSSILAQSQQPSAVPKAGIARDARGKSASPVAQPDQKPAGTISGTVIVQTGAVAVGAQVQLTREDKSSKLEVLSGDNGEYSFGNLPAGPFQLTITSPGFATESFSGVLNPEVAFVVPPIMLNVATAVTEVSVQMTQVEVAEEQIKLQEQQRVLGFIPNFYVSYLPDAAPMVPKQKFKLAWKSSTDLITIVGVGALAGIQQAADDYSGYGQGAEGYARRFGAA